MLTGAARQSSTVGGAAAFTPLAWAVDAGWLLALIWCIPAGILLLGLPLVAAIRLGLELVERVLAR